MNYKVNKILYYKVEDKTFPTEEEAKKYALLLFLKDEAEKDGNTITCTKTIAFI